MVLGPTDVGKTTFAWWLARELAQRGPVAVVDADVGQARIGPAACVGWQTLGATELELYFVGATSPERRPMSALKATLQASRAAYQAGHAWVVVDTTGYLAGETAIALKSLKIKHLRPVHVVAIGDHPSFGPLLDPWLSDPQVTVHRLPRPPGVREKPASFRARWRRELFAEWLAGSNLRWLGSEQRKFLHMPPWETHGQTDRGATQLRGLLLGFGDAQGRCLGLGLLHSVDWHGRRVLALCGPEAEACQVVDFGCIRLRPDGSPLDGG